jgi:hypothetical protein
VTNAEIDEERMMSPIILRIRSILYRRGELKSVDADVSGGLSNGAILKRLKEINDPQIAEANDDASSEDIVE